MALFSDDKVRTPVEQLFIEQMIAEDNKYMYFGEGDDAALDDLAGLKQQIDTVDDPEAGPSECNTVECDSPDGQKNVVAEGENCSSGDDHEVKVDDIDPIEECDDAPTPDADQDDNM